MQTGFFYFISVYANLSSSFSHTIHAVRTGTNPTFDWDEAGMVFTRSWDTRHLKFLGRVNSDWQIIGGIHNRYYVLAVWDVKCSKVFRPSKVSYTNSCCYCSCWYNQYNYYGYKLTIVTWYNYDRREKSLSSLQLCRIWSYTTSADTTCWIANIGTLPDWTT